MKLDWRPTRPAFIDFETWSPVPLKSRKRYVDRCVILCSALRVDGVTHVDPDRELLERVARDRTLVAHNAPFDAAVWDSLSLPPATWCNTLPMARAAGLPGKLDRLGLVLESAGKDVKGKQVLDLFVKSKILPPPHLPIYDILRAYCARDVELLETVYENVKTFGEPDVMSADHAINERGVPIDREYLQALHDVMERNTEEADERVRKHFNPKSPKQVKEWLIKQGYDVASCAAEVLKEITFDEDTEEVMSDRAEVMRVGLGKAREGLASLDDDGFLRDQFAYWASLPGRWASYGLQLHNMPKSVGYDCRHVRMDWDSVSALAEQYECRISDVTNGALRHCVRSPDMLVADFAAVEPRMLAWLCGDDEMLAVYGDPKRNAYFEMGRKVFNRPITKADELEYFISKQLVIACGYGASGWKFQLSCKKFGYDLKRGYCEDLVRTFRKTSPGMTGLWRAYGDAAMNAVKQGHDTEVGRVGFRVEGSSLVIRLPSGRDVYYRNARVERTVPVYKVIYSMPLTPEDTVVYDHPMFGRRELYGGKITENVDQGACRDLLAYVLVELETQGFEPFMHAHDEAAALRGSFSDFMRVCSTPPSWCPDFPLMAEGYQGPMWAKDASGWMNAKYLRGKPCG